MLLVSFNLGVILIAAVLALTIIFIWACSWYFDLVPKPKGYVKLELDRDRVPLKIGSTFTVYGVTLTVVEGYTDKPNEVQATKSYNQQWENVFTALSYAEISPGVKFIDYYSLSYGFYITITDMGRRDVPALPSGFFDGAIILHEINS